MEELEMLRNKTKEIKKQVVEREKLRTKVSIDNHKLKNSYQSHLGRL